MTLADVSERLLAHPTIRQFLLSFDELDWPEVVQTAAVLGIQALVAKYGNGARLTDVGLMRAIARSVVRKGDWPFSLDHAALVDAEDELETIPPVQPGISASAAVQPAAAARRQRAGRSLPPPGSRVAGRRGAAVVGRVRRKSAPPEVGGRGRRLSKRSTAASGSGSLPKGKVTRSSSSAAAGGPKRHGGFAEGLRNMGGAIDERIDVEDADWYARLMSRLERLNPKLSSANQAPRKLNFGGVAPSRPDEPEDRHEDSCLPSGNLYHVRQQLRLGAAASGPCDPEPRDSPQGSIEHMRHQLHLDVNTALPPLVPRVPSGAGRSLGISPAAAQTAEMFDGKDNSILLSQLPGREERRELHLAALHGPFN